MRKTLEDLPDGIHSGLARVDAKGVFFYFVADGKPDGHTRRTREHYWRYLDLANGSGRIEDNRYLIANLIQCQQDTPRLVPAPGEVDIFALQEKVIASILQSSVEQVAVEEAPKLLDPIHQMIITTLRRYINSPTVSRQAIVEAVQKLNEPQPSVYVRALRRAYEAFTASGDLTALLEAIGNLEASKGYDAATGEDEDAMPRCAIKREDLHLICFDYLWQ